MEEAQKALLPENDTLSGCFATVDKLLREDAPSLGAPNDDMCLAEFLMPQSVRPPSLQQGSSLTARIPFSRDIMK